MKKNIMKIVMRISQLRFLSCLLLLLPFLSLPSSQPSMMMMMMMTMTMIALMMTKWPLLLRLLQRLPRLFRNSRPLDLIRTTFRATVNEITSSSPSSFLGKLRYFICGTTQRETSNSQKNGRMELASLLNQHSTSARPIFDHIKSTTRK